MTLRELFIGLGFRVDESSEKKANDAIKSFKDKAGKILGAIGVGFSLVSLNQLSEEFRTTNDQIAQGTKLLGNQSEIQKKILDSANRTRTSYADSAKVVSALVQENSELFGTIDEAIAFNDAATMLFKSAGKSNEQIAGLMEAINKSFAKGVVDSETMSQLLEQSPEAVNLLNRRLGTTSDQLEQMVTDGKISLADLKGAFVDNADEIAAAFDGTSFKISDALLNVRNQFGLWVADMDESLGISTAIGTAMVKGFTLVMDVLRRVQTRVEWLAEKLGGTERLFQLIGTIAASAFGVIALPKLLMFLTTIKKIDRSLLAAKLKILAIIAVVTLIALLIQDFISFMKGENSLIGELFDKAGIGAENARQTILQAWGAIKDFLLTVWEAIKQAAQVIFGALSKWWEQNGDAVMESFSQIWEGIKTLCITLWNALSDAAQAIFGALRQFWDTWGGTIITIFTTIWNTLISLIQPFLDAIAAIIQFLASVFTGDWEGAWTAIKDFAAAIWQMIVTICQAAWNSIMAVFAGVAEWFTGIFQAAWNGIMAVFSGVGDFFQGVWNTIVELFTSIGTAVGDAISGAVKGAVNAVLSGAIGIINGFISAINFAIGIINAIPGVEIPILDTLDVPQLAKGGYVDANKPQLAVIGDNKQEGEIVSPVSKMRDTVFDAMRALLLLSTPTASAQTPASTINSNTIVQNVNINNKFEGDRAGQQKSSEAMDKAAEDSTAELARALQYAR